MLKKITAMLLVLAMAAALLVGCANSNAPEADPQQNVSAAADASEDTKETAKNEEPVSLRIILYGDPNQRATEFFKNEFHEKVLQDLNIDMTVDYLPWGSSSQIMTMAASGEGFAFISNPTENPELMAAGLYSVFDEDMIRELAPNYIAARMNGGFECAKYNGEIAVIPTGYITNSAPNQNLGIRNDILNEVGWDVSQITDLDTLNEAVAAVHAKYPDMKIIRGVYNLYGAIEDLTSTDGIMMRVQPNYICAVDESQPDSDLVISNYETEEFKNFCKLTREWFELGYLTVEDLTDEGAASTAWDTGNCLMSYSSAGTIYDHRLGAGTIDADVQFLHLNKNPELIRRDYPGSFLITKADQDKVESWIKFIDWIYASKENYVFTMWGVEGKDWNYDENGDVKVVSDVSMIYSWMLKTLYYEAPSTELYDAEEVEKYVHYDESAIYSKAIGFSFDQTPVQAEATALNTIITEKIRPLVFGVADYDTEFPAILEELKAAGLDAYVAEYQRQFSEFMANK